MRAAFRFARRQARYYRNARAASWRACGSARERLTTPDTLSRGSENTPGDPWSGNLDQAAAPPQSERQVSRDIINSTETIGEQAPQLLQPAGSQTVRPVTIDGAVGSSAQQFGRNSRFEQ
jgi:hypothetical protein